MPVIPPGGCTQQRAATLSSGKPQTMFSVTFYTQFPDFSEKNRSGWNFSAPPTGRPNLAHGGMLVALAWGHRRPARKPTPLASAKAG